MNVYITASGPDLFPQAVKTDSTRGRGGKKVFLEEVKFYCTQSRQTKTFSIPLPQSLHFFFSSSCSSSRSQWSITHISRPRTAYHDTRTGEKISTNAALATSVKYGCGRAIIYNRITF